MSEKSEKSSEKCEDAPAFLTDDEFWAEVERLPRPLAQVPAGFPSTHSRYPAIVSPAHDIEKLPHRDDPIQGLVQESDEDERQWREQLQSLLQPAVYLNDPE